MTKHDDALSDRAVAPIIPDDRLVSSAVARLSARIVELEAVQRDLARALTRYRSEHDRARSRAGRPCDCEHCQQAEAALARARGGA